MPLTYEELDRLVRAKMDARAAAVAVLRQEQTEADAAQARAADATAALAAAQQIAQSIQQQAHERLAGVVSRCLAAVFAQPYEFKMVFAAKRGRTEVELRFTRDGVDVDPTEAAGGGVVDVASFALRLACLCLARPPARRTIVMDEPFKFVSRQYRDGVRAMLEALADEMGVQFIMVTHVDELRCGTVVEVG